MLSCKLSSEIQLRNFQHLGNLPKDIASAGMLLSHELKAQATSKAKKLLLDEPHCLLQSTAPLLVLQGFLQQSPPSVHRVQTVKYFARSM